MPLLIVTRQTPLLVLTNLIMIFCVYFLMKPALVYPYKVPRLKRNVSVIIILLFCMFSFWGADWFHYLAQFNNIREGLSTNLEEIYEKIIVLCGNSYLSFRLIVWGIALFLVLQTFKRLSINKNIVLLLFGCIWVTWFAYARVSLAMAMIFYGIAIIYRPKPAYKVISYIVGVVLIGVSFFFHKTAIFGIVVVVISMFLRNPSKGKVLVLIALVPVLLYLAQDYLANFMSLEFAEDSSDLAEYANVGQNYLNQEYAEKGLGSILMRVLEVSPYYLLVAQIVAGYSSKQRKQIPQDIKMFMNILFVIVLLSSLFIFNLGVNTSIVYIRFMRFAAIPSCIVLSYLLEGYQKTRWARRTFQIAFLAAIYSITYIMYTVFVQA